MRSEQEMLALVRDKLARLRRRRRRAALSGAGLAAALVIGGLGLVAASGDDRGDRVRTTADSPDTPDRPDGTTGPSTTEAPVTDDDTAPPGAQVAVPSVVGLEAGRAAEIVLAAGLGDGPRAIDFRYIADPEIVGGLVMGQTPSAGTNIDVDSPIVLQISAGGPVIGFEELPPPARSFVDDLDDIEDLSGGGWDQAPTSYDRAEPILVVTTDHGTAYKTDNWLFGPCPAVEAAYRTFPDPTYNDDCY